MNTAVESVVCSVVASIIYDVAKYGLGQLDLIKKNLKKDDVEKYVFKRLEKRYDALSESGIFVEFIKTPLIMDTIHNYILYVITGKIEMKLPQNHMLIKSKNHLLIEENEVVTFLVDSLMEKYEENEVLTKPPKRLLVNFFSEVFKICSEYVFNKMKEEDIAMIYFINSKMNVFGNGIFAKLEEIASIINRSIQTSIIYDDNVLLKNKRYYTRVLKENNRMAHIYLLDKFDINEFYVPPFLTGNEKVRSINNRYLRNRVIYKNSVVNSKKEELFDDWKYIFERSNIVYVTGGAGYGKSLFMQKIIEEYEELNLINAEEYMVIYGELKMFYTQSLDIPMSVSDFLQNSMKKETLIEEEIVSKDLINYYLKRGRCIILLDALDEVQKDKRDTLHELVVNYFKNQNPNNKVCITSRARGFLPEKDIEVLEIEPLDAIQIEMYVDNIIRLGKFDEKDKEAFLNQTRVLVQKGFLNSFLVLSLLINIYKAEKELPENKLELYQKCFEYIANKREREKDKSQEKYDWKLISILMKDNTFMELSNMCLPNNNDVSKEIIKEKLTGIYKTKYVSENETELAIEQFLQFCSDRTELFVPASGEDSFKFFHRSFFEYFYSQYIFTRLQETESIYNAFGKFDVDSEVFELTLAMFKQKNESKYQEIVEFILQKISDKSLEEEIRINALNIFVLSLQVIDDELYKLKFVNILIEEYNFLIKNINRLHNQVLLIEMIESKEEYYNKICDKYSSIAKYEAIKSFLNLYSDVERMLKERNKRKEFDNKFEIVGYKLKIVNNTFYSQVFFNHKSTKIIFAGLKTTDIERVALDCKASKKEINKIKNKYNKYLKLDINKRKEIEKILLENN